jgi:hypothetical protein
MHLAGNSIFVGTYLLAVIIVDLLRTTTWAEIYLHPAPLPGKHWQPSIITTIKPFTRRISTTKKKIDNIFAAR